MVNKDFQNGFALGLASGGVVKSSGGSTSQPQGIVKASVQSVTEVIKTTVTVVKN